MAQNRHPRDPKPMLLAFTSPPLSHTGLHHALISYNIAFTPSARTVVDHMVHFLLPAVMLMQAGCHRCAGRLPGDVLPQQGR